MSIQAAVSKYHMQGKRCEVNALHHTVMEVWNNGHLSEKAFKNVHGRLQVVLKCIVDDNGGNSLVESRRGKLFRDATITDSDEETNENEDDSSSMSSTDDEMDEN